MAKGHGRTTHELDGARNYMRNHARPTTSIQESDALAELIFRLLRQGLAPRNRAERRATRAVAYGDHLEALLADVRDAKRRRPEPVS
jgi:hypothetical protein